MKDDQYQLDDFDPMTPEFIEDPHKFLHELRERAPIGRSERWGGFWALTKRKDVVAIAKNHKQFLNSVTHIVPGGMAGTTRPLMHVDPPEHTDFRKVMMPVFNGPVIDAITPEVRVAADELVDSLVAEGHANLEVDFAGRLMALTLKIFYGMDNVDAVDLHHWLQQYVAGGQCRDQEMVKEAHEYLMSVAVGLVEDRKVNPRDPATDLTTALLQAEPALPEDRIIAAVRQPFIIVFLATSHTLGNMLLRLTKDSDLQKALRESPELIAEALEEFFRMDMPQLGFARTSNGDFEFGGKTFKDREPIALVFPAANRDPEVFEDPDDFKIGRSPNPHLTFGAGIHACPGKHIARAVVQIALEAIITRTGSFELDGEIEPEHWPFRAARNIPVKLTAPADTLPDSTHLASAR